mmetsp:Transcript_34228/g.96194  ORF Transcript_34228/g.96194 Transcript_34228/m.96194 type:complete len:246 (+) Transcript_34228:15-752(+)
MSHLPGRLRTATAFIGSPFGVLASEKLRSGDAENWDSNGEQEVERGVAPVEAVHGRDVTAACCTATLSSCSRHAGSRKMAHARIRSAGAECGRDLDTLMMTLFSRALARHLIMWSTSKPARHSRICALSRDCAIFARCGGENGVICLPLLSFRWGASRPMGAAAPSLVPAPPPAGAERDGSLAATTAAASAAAASARAKSSGVKARGLPRSPADVEPWPVTISGRAVASGSWILCASPQSSYVSR